MLREAGRLLGEGEDVAEVGWQLRISQQTYYRWRHQFGGLKAEVRRLRDVEIENDARLKRIVADKELKNLAFWEVAQGTVSPSRLRIGMAMRQERLGLRRGCLSDRPLAPATQRRANVV